MKKTDRGFGLRLVGLILGITGAVVSITGIVFSAIGLARARRCRICQLEEDFR